MLMILHAPRRRPPPSADAEVGSPHARRRRKHDAGRRIGAGETARGGGLASGLAAAAPDAAFTISTANEGYIAARGRRLRCMPALRDG